MITREDRILVAVSSPVRISRIRACDSNMLRIQPNRAASATSVNSACLSLRNGENRRYAEASSRPKNPVSR